MRIGAVSYLNTKPLVYGLAELAPQHELVFDLPSRLADRLAAGQLDVALIPSAEYFQNPDYTIVSDACIGCRGPVRSVKLLSRVPPAQIRTLALDEGSRTSAALVQILLRERFGLSPHLLPFPIDAAPESIAADALLMIGDRAMHPPAGEYVAEWDLGDVWCRWAELPFVFAMWVARQETGDRERGTAGELTDLPEILSQARDRGVAHVEEIARQEHARYGLTDDDCLTYLRDHLHFTLGPRERAGLAMFREYCGRYSLISTLARTNPGPQVLQHSDALAQSGSKFAPG
ncbi:MAG: menaquinone biosynthesis protein [Pirellulaceae bacterium]|jgi:chorismate dehydratase|nr:menaquinone biosynthesis protein [Pirellulaceae bacterium]